MYEEIIEPILTNEIVVDWIAPIITTILATIILAGLGKIILNEKIKNKIKISNEKILNAIRPFIIQQIPITKEMIISIRTAISMENEIKLKYLYTLEELKNRVILDIAETRFLKENDKTKLFKQINKIFAEDFENIKVLDNSIEVECENTYDEVTRNIGYTIYMLILISVMIIVSLFEPTQIQNETIRNIVAYLIIFVLLVPIIFILYKFEIMAMKGIKKILEKFIGEE